MYFLLYTLLGLNLIKITIDYTNHDMLGVRHGATFFLVSLVALGLTWLAGREGGRHGH